MGSTPQDMSARIGAANQLKTLIAEYWDAAIAEGQDGRAFDTEYGRAGALWWEINAAIDALAAPGAETAAPTEPGAYHAWCGDIEDEATLRRVSSVMQDVLTDISDWEDTALAEAVEESKRDIDAMVERFSLAAPAAQPATMTTAEFFAEAKRIGLTADVLAAQLSTRPEFADCLPAAQPEATKRVPNGYAYEYPGPFGGIHFTGGGERNGSKPLRAVPYWFEAQPEAAAVPAGWHELVEDMARYAPAGKHWKDPLRELKPRAISLLAAAPAVAVPPLLTDEQIDTMVYSRAHVKYHIEFARAVEAAVREQFTGGKSA